MSKTSYIKKVFPNGLKYIYVPQPQSMATTVLILVSTGSEYEKKEINGISHFLEHLCFKGTKRRPDSGLISHELDSLGAEYNAFTGNEITGYFAKAANKNFQKILDVVSDLYLNPIIDENEMNKERGVIIEEINMYEDLPMEKVREDFNFLLYGDQPAGWSIAGRKDVIQKLTKDDIHTYRNLHYIAPKTTVVVAGGLGVNPEVVIGEYFAGIGTGNAISKIKTVENQDCPKTFFREKQTDQTHLVMGVRAFDLFDDRKYALSVLSDVLGGSMSSRLFKKIRDEMGAAYYIRSSADLSSDCGMLAVSTGVDKERVSEIVEAILFEMKDIRDNLLKEDELNKAKEHISGRLVLQLETSDEVAGFYGSEEAIMGFVRTPEEILENIKKITAEDVRNVARDIIKDDRLNLCAIGMFAPGTEDRVKNIFKLS
jgi:predicted Zn-dependent peptidase